MMQDKRRTNPTGQAGTPRAIRIEPSANDLGEAARAVGTQHFYQRLLQIYGRLAPHEIITVVRYNRFSRPDFLFHRRFSDELVQVYLDGFYELDPFYLYWIEHEQPGIVALHELPSGELKRRRYTAEIMRHSRIRDELAMFLPPVARSSVAVVLERVDGTFRDSEIEHIRGLYPLLAGIHDAHVRCTFAKLGGDETAFGINENVATAIVDISGETVFTNGNWRVLDKNESELRRSVDFLDASTARRVDMSGNRVLHRTVLDKEFTLAPGGWLYSVELRNDKPAIEPARDMFARFCPALSSRELDIVELVLQGCSNRVIAERLFLSRGTVKNHRRRLYDKLDISTERELFLAHIELAFGH